MGFADQAISVAILLISLAALARFTVVYCRSVLRKAGQ
jgi:hypothetical protein